MLLIISILKAPKVETSNVFMFGVFLFTLCYMKKVVFGILIAVTVMLVYMQFTQKNNSTVIKENSALIEKSIKNVGKLVVTEGHFSEVFSYENSKSLFSDFIQVEKKALVVVNADVTVAYDLSKIKYELNQDNKTLRIIGIPPEEIKINPDLEYYDVKADYLNPFEAEDYNAIKETINKRLIKKIEASDLKSNAKNRLFSELSKFYILTNSLGWRLEYNEMSIDNIDALNTLKL